MRGAEGVVFALGALGEAGEAATLTQRPDAVAPPGQDLVRIGLVADVPDQPVVGGVEHIVQCNGEFDDAQACPQVTARHCHRVDGFGAQLVRNLPQVLFGNRAKVGRALDRIQHCGH